MANNTESEIKLWLATALKSENLGEFLVKIVGKSGKGDGYVGDVVFVQVSNPEKKYNLVLKCNKQNEALQGKKSLKLIFLNEIFMYQTVLPTFIQFQKSQNLKEIFESVLKCFGSYQGDKSLIIVLEDLQKIGYELWPKRKPLNRKHLDLVVKEYGKFHATSVALKHQQAEKFQELVNEVEQNIKLITNSKTMEALLKKSLEQSEILLKNKLDENVIQKFVNLKEQIGIINSELENDKRLKVICHGDCWNNNFMYKYNEDDKIAPSRVAFLDWQIARYATPICDLSYFLFCCISEEDIKDLDNILITYHKSFSNHVEKFGLNPENFYSFKQFSDDWKTCSRYGLVMAILVTKASYTEKEEIVDMGEAADKGKTLVDTFLPPIKNSESYGKRIAYLIKEAANSGLF